MEIPATNTTTPSNPPYKWIGEPNQRGTFGIISLCFSTLIICIWSTLHFNVPAKRYTATRRFFIEVFWMILALLAPEVLLYLAINERITAGVLLQEVLKFHPHLAKPGMFTRMRNWICGQAESSRRYNPVEKTPQPHFGLVHAYYAVMGGFAFYRSYDDDTPKSLFEISTNPRCTIDVLEYDGLIYIMKHFPHVITNITEDYILDQAVSSGLSKALLIVQVAWFCMNCASRFSQRLPLSLLEVSTTAHAVCTLVTYFVWWSKPANVAVPTLLMDKEAREVYALLSCSDDEYGNALEVAQKGAAGDSSMPTEPHASEKIVLAARALQHLLPTPERPPRYSNFHRGDRVLVPGRGGIPLEAGFSPVITIAISPILYGVGHFLAWSDQFPTPLERLVWRISSFFVTFLGLVVVFTGLALERFEKKYKRNDSKLSALAIFIMIVVVPLAHVLASGFLIIESVRQLFFLDDATYQLPAWSNYWPHFS